MWSALTLLLYATSCIGHSAAHCWCVRPNIQFRPSTEDWTPCCSWPNPEPGTITSTDTWAGTVFQTETFAPWKWKIMYRFCGLPKKKMCTQRYRILVKHLIRVRRWKTGFHFAWGARCGLSQDRRDTRCFFLADKWAHWRTTVQLANSGMA